MGLDSREVTERAGIDAINRRTYRDRKVSADYAAHVGLQPPEARILRLIGPAVRGGRILDLGVGGGRTLPFLKPLGDAYVGLDYSREMIAACRALYPGEDLRVGDARRLTDFEDGSCRLVFFSFNGIDYVPHPDRMQILSEAYRVLAPGGYFVFSTHNEAWRRAQPPTTRLELPRRPLSALKGLAHAMIGLYHHLRNKRFEVHAATYAIVNDVAHNYRLLTYFTTIEHQRRQLQAAGFQGPIKAFDLEGRETNHDDTSPWIYYCARKV